MVSPLQQLQTSVVTLTPSLAKLYKEELIGHVQVRAKYIYLRVLLLATFRYERNPHILKEPSRANYYSIIYQQRPIQ